MDLTYLASPYSVGGADAAERKRRYQLVCRVAGALMAQGENIFCPIAHSHPIEIYSGEILKNCSTHEFWLKQDFAILRHCSRMKVLLLPGIDWHESVGITREVQFANRYGIPIFFITEEQALQPCQLST
jgi:hypothetical protein